MDALGYLRHLLDPTRLAVVGRVAAAPASADEVAEATGVRRRDVLEALAPLVEAGIVLSDGDRYRLAPDALRELAGDLPTPQPPAEAIFFGMTEEESEILARFFRGRRLAEIPSTRAKRLVVLERIALEFEPGVTYPEAEVNAVLSEFHGDYASLRRWLVDEGLLDRGDGVYWRSGGRVDVEAGMDPPDGGVGPRKRRRSHT